MDEDGRYYYVFDECTKIVYNSVYFLPEKIILLDNKKFLFTCRCCFQVIDVNDFIYHTINDENFSKNLPFCILIFGEKTILPHLLIYTPDKYIITKSFINFKYWSMTFSLQTQSKLDEVNMLYILNNNS